MFSFIRKCQLYYNFVSYLKCHSQFSRWKQAQTGKVANDGM